MKIAVVDCLTHGNGMRKFTRDFIGSGPRYVAGFIELYSEGVFQTQIFRAEDIISKRQNHLQNFPILCISAMSMDKETVIKIISIWIKFYPNENRRLCLIGGPIIQENAQFLKYGCDLEILGEGEDLMYHFFHTHSTNIVCAIENNLNDSDPKDWKLKIIESFLNSKSIISGSIINKLNSLHSVRSYCDHEKFAMNSGFPKKITEYTDFQNSRVFVELLRGCSNYYRISLPIENGQSCEDSPCKVCRDSRKEPLFRCPQNIPPGCGFCACFSTFGSVKSREIAPIIQEIQDLIRLGVSRIVLGAPDFLDFHREDLVGGLLTSPRSPEPNYEALDFLIDALLAIPQVRQEKVQLFIENVKATLCTDRALEIIAKIPNSVFSIGCETGSETFSKVLGRPGNPDETYTAVKRALLHNIRVHVYFIHSLPGDNEKFATETLNFIDKLIDIHVNKITLYKYQKIPGSPFYRVNRKYSYFDKKTLRIFEKIKKKCIVYNKEQKNHYIGKIVPVMISEPNSIRENDAIGWMLEGGPKISVRDGKKYINSIQKILITNIISDRLVEGQIIHE